MKKKRLLAAILVVVLLFGLFNTTGFAGVGPADSDTEGLGVSYTHNLRINVYVGNLGNNVLLQQINKNDVSQEKIIAYYATGGGLALVNQLHADYRIAGKSGDFSADDLTGNGLAVIWYNFEKSRHEVHIFLKDSKVSYIVRCIDKGGNKIIDDDVIDKIGNKDCKLGDEITVDAPSITGYTRESQSPLTQRLDFSTVFEFTYQQDDYKVTFDAGNKGTLTDQSLAEQQVKHGEGAQDPGVTPKDGYEFTGWDKDFDNVTEPLIVNAIYKKLKHTVTFNPGDEGRISLYGPKAVQKVWHGHSAFSPIVIPNEGWFFTGWDAKFNCVTQEMTINAQYTKMVYWVWFKPGDHGAFEDGADTFQWIKHGEAATAPTVVPEPGWEFDGWSGSFDEVKKCLAIKALYKEIEPVVTFDPGAHGTFDPAVAAAVQTIAYGGSATAPTVIPYEGYEFSSWDTCFTNVTEKTLTVTAQYKLKDYKVSFLPGDNGTFDADTPTEQQVPHGSAATAPKVNAKTGYKFTSWDKEFSSVKGDLTITALYEKLPFKVTFQSNGGSEVAATTALYDTLVTQPTAPTMLYYSFKGWYKDAALTQVWNFAVDKIGAADLILYAKWEADPITNLKSRETMSVGGRKSWSPQPPNGTWNWDSDYLERLSNGEFKALQVGVTNVVYTANGLNFTIEVTINEAILPVTGQQSLWIWILGGLGLCAAAGAGVLFLRKRQHGTSEE